MNARREIRASGDGCALEVRADVYGEPGRGPLDYRSEVLARYTLRWLPDTSEVVLLKDTPHGEDHVIGCSVYAPEAVHSDILDQGKGN